MGILDTFYILFDTDAKKAEREMADLRHEGDRTADQIDRSVRGARHLAPAIDKAADEAGRLGRSFTGVASIVTGVLAGIAAANIGGGLLNAAEGYTRFGNALRVAGLEGEQLRVVEDALYASAKRNGVELESLSQLYGRVTSASTELGVSQAEILQVTDAVSAAIRVQGGDASQASGAMLQLAQALGAGTVRAEEFNSITEGMLPLLQAAAFASDKYKGSVARMRADVLAGTLTSKEFFDLIREGSTYLRDKAARAPLTVAQSMTALRSSVVVTVGRLNEAWGVTRRLGAALGFLAQHLDLAAIVIGTVATALTVFFLPAIWSAAAGVLAATWPILLLIAAAAALGVAFALAYDDVKAFLSGQDSLIGSLLERYAWLRTLLHGLGVVFRVVGRIAVAVFGAIWSAAARTFGAIADGIQQAYGFWAPIFGLMLDVAVAVFRAVGGWFMNMIRPWLPAIRFVLAAIGQGARLMGAVFGAVFDAIGAWWDRTIGRIIQGVNIIANAVRRLMGMEVSDRQSAAVRGVGIGQRQLAGAANQPFAAMTAPGAAGSVNNRRSQVINMGGVTQNINGPDANAVSRSLADAFGGAASQFDDGVAF